MLLPGLLIELAAESEIEIQQLSLVRDGDETIHPMVRREARVRLRRGTLIASVGRAQTDSFLFVETPAATLVAGPERTFKVVLGDNQARVLSVRGKIEVQPAGAQKKGGEIPAGYFANLPLTPSQAAAAAGAEVQAEVAAVLSAQERLLRLERERGSDFQRW